MTKTKDLKDLITKRYKEEPQQTIKHYTQLSHNDEEIQDTRAKRKQRNFIIYGLFFFFVFVFISGLVIVILYGLAMLPNLSENIKWVLGILLADIIGATIYTWKAFSKYLFGDRN